MEKTRWIRTGLGEARYKENGKGRRRTSFPETPGTKTTNSRQNETREGDKDAEIEVNRRNLKVEEKRRGMKSRKPPGLT